MRGAGFNRLSARERDDLTSAVEDGLEKAPTLETIVLGLALSLGLRPHYVLSIRCGASLGDSNDAFTPGMGRSQFVFRRVVGGRIVSVEIVAPIIRLVCKIRPPNKWDGSLFLDTFFPEVSPDEAIERINVCLKGVLDANRWHLRRDLQIEALARSVAYAQSGSRAAIVFRNLRTGLVSTESQTYYISPEHSAAVLAMPIVFDRFVYSLGSFRIRREALEKSVPKSTLLPDDFASAAAQEIRGSASLWANFFEPTSGSASPPVEQRAVQGIVDFHNRFVAYCLMALIFSTGHRRSRTPFFFEHDFDFDMGLCFVADKQIGEYCARWIPLSEPAAKQVIAYQTYRRWFLAWCSVHIPKILVSLSQSGDPFFFAIGRSNRVHAMSSNRAASYTAKFLKLESAMLDPLTLRRVFANELLCSLSCTDDRQFVSISGHHLSALMGHAGDLHPLGSSSIWSIKRVANTTRISLEGRSTNFPHWEPPKAPISVASPNRKGSVWTVPRLIGQGYERRTLDRKAAGQRAAEALDESIIRAGLQRWQPALKQSDFDELLTTSQSLLVDDDLAKDALPQLIAKVRQRKQRGGVRIYARSQTVLRVQAPPVSVHSARHCAWAEEFRNHFQVWMTSPSFEVTTGDDLCVVALLSLVAFDAVLDSSQLAASVASMQSDVGLYALGNRLVLRIEQARSDGTEADRVVYLGAYSATLIAAMRRMGIVREREFVLNADQIDMVVRKVQDRLEIPSDAQVRSLDEFVRCFVDWWRLRIPGVLMAVANGKVACPALTRESESRLFGERSAAKSAEDMAAELLTESKKVGKDQNNSRSKDAYEADKWLKSLLQQAAVANVSGKGSKRAQRMRLRTLLDEAHSDPKWGLHPTTQVLLGFLDSLFSRGGHRVRVLAFSTIRDYFSPIRVALIAHAWGEDVGDWEDDKFVALYRAIRADRVATESSDVNTEIALFHRFLESEYAVPPVAEAYRAGKRSFAPRGAIMLDREVRMIAAILNTQQAQKHRSGRHIKLLFALLAQYGMRANEALGLVAPDVIPAFEGRNEIACSANGIRSLKSPSARRLIDVCLTDEPVLIDVVKNTARKAKVDQSDARPLFQDPAVPGARVDAGPLRRSLIELCRAVTGDPSFVLHSLRHTFISGLVSHLIPPPDHEDAEIRKCVDALPGKFAAQILHAGYRDKLAYPFMVDRVAELVGHADDDTLLNVYFHTGALHLSEYARSENLCCVPPHRFVVNLLHNPGGQPALSRSATARKAREKPPVEVLPAKECRAPLMSEKPIGYLKIPPIGAKSLHDAICETAARVVSRLSSPRRGKSAAAATVQDLPPRKRGRPRKSAVKASAAEHGEENAQSTHTDWHVFDRLLCERHHNETPFAEGVTQPLVDCGTQPDAARAWVRRYNDAVLRTGVTDFEHPLSELTLVSAPCNKGLKKFAIRRQAALARIESWAAESNENYDALATTARAWVANRSSDPDELIAVKPEEVIAIAKLMGGGFVDPEHVTVDLTLPGVQQGFDKLWASVNARVACSLASEERPIFLALVESVTPVALRVRIGSSAPVFLRSNGMRRIMLIVAATI